MYVRNDMAPAINIHVGRLRNIITSTHKIGIGVKINPIFCELGFLIVFILKNNSIG